MISVGELRKFEKIIKGFSKVKILVIGDVMLDRFIWGKVSRISPEAPVPVVVVENNNDETFHLGGAANVINNIHSLKAEGLLCGIVGDDENGERIKDMMTRSGINTEGIFIEKGRQTTVKTRIFADQQQVVRIDRETINHPKNNLLEDISKFIKNKIGDYDRIIISDYGKGFLTGNLIRMIIRKAKNLGKSVMVDPKLRNSMYYRGASIVTPNLKEACELSGIPHTDPISINKIGKKLLKIWNCNFLVITQGRDGMTIFEYDQDPYPVPTEPKEVFNITGTGDTVIGVMALALEAGASIIEAAKLANYAAGIVILEKGTATINYEKLIGEIKEKIRKKI